MQVTRFLPKVGSAVQFLRFGTNLGKIRPMALHLLQINSTLDVKQSAQTMVNECQRKIETAMTQDERLEAAKTLGTAPKAACATRFGTQNDGVEYFSLTGLVLVMCVTIIFGRCTRYQDCCQALATPSDGQKMAAKFCETLQSKEIEVYRRITEVKVRLVIRPIQSLAEKGEHCSGTVMLGPSGKIACVLQRWVKSLVVMKVPRRTSYILNEYGNGAKRGSRPIGTTEIPLPEEITLPRASDWHRAFVVPGTNKANIARLIVGFVQRTHVELVNRFERHVIGIVPRLIGVAREHAFFQRKGNGASLPLDGSFESLTDVIKPGSIPVVKPVLPLEVR